MAEKYLHKEAERTRQELSPPSITSEKLKAVLLRDAPDLYRRRLLEIFNRAAQGEAVDDGTKKQRVFSIPEIEQDKDIPIVEFKNSCCATIVGSAMQGKSSLVNSVLGLFGYDTEDGQVAYPGDLLPTERGQRCGLPFPVRLEYGDKYSLDMKVWAMDELGKVMKAVAHQKDGDFWDDPEFRQPPADNSFLQFVCDHGDMTGGDYVIRPSGQLVLDSLKTCWTPPEVSCLSKHRALFEYLKSLVQEPWFGYEQITLKCPSVLLKRMRDDLKRPVGIVDLPAVQICDDNNGYIEEVVFRHVQDADSIIVLTGERSLTSDILEILRRSVFERLLDTNKLPPAVAIMNSSNLRGLQVEEMASWRNITLLGQMGWNKEVELFASSEFKQRQHREIESVAPQLFPNDLKKLVGELVEQSKILSYDHHLEITSRYPGVSALIGYFMWLPQDSILAGLQHISDRAKAMTTMVDHLWQVDKVALNLLSLSEGAKEARRLREEEFNSTLDAKLTTASLKEMFSFKGVLKEEVDTIFYQQWKYLAAKLQRLSKHSTQLKEEAPGLLRSALKQVASTWDKEVGQDAFTRFLSAGQELASTVLDDRVNKAFMTSARSDQSQAASMVDTAYIARDSLKVHLQDSVKERINDSRFKYTLTDSFRQQCMNLDVGDVFRAVRVKGQAAVTPATFEQVLMDLERIFLSKKKPFVVQVEKHMKMQSHPIKQLIALLKSEIKKGFLEYMKNFVMVKSVLESVARSPETVLASSEPVAKFRGDLARLVRELTSYIEKHHERRDKFGEEELLRVLKSRLSTTGGQGFGKRQKTGC